MSHLAAGFMLGVAGSAHCLGMCGPFVVLAGRGRYLVIHHAVRTVMYVALGAIAGYSGAAIAGAGWRNMLAIVAGAILIAQSTGLIGRLAGAAPARLIGRAASRVYGAIPARPLTRAIACGALNGLLPCGLLYAALAAAAGLGDLVAAIEFAAAFGAGTLPVFGLLAWSTALYPRLPRRLARAAPIALALVGLLLIARGWPFSLHAGH